MEQAKVEYQSAGKRAKNFREVSLGYSKRIALDEARRCPQCADPVCHRACPLGIDIPGFIRNMREGNHKVALDMIRQRNPLPSVCGRICSAPCEAACVLQEEQAPIGIRALERYAADWGEAHKVKKIKAVPRGRKIAVIGSGPAGLAASSQLTDLGYAVTIFEALDLPGGVLRYGIPEFRMPKNILDAEIEHIQMKGVEIKTNAFIGQTYSLEELAVMGFESILLSTGAGTPQFMDLPGTHLGGVYYGEEFLMRTNLIKKSLFKVSAPQAFVGENVVVIGSGNTALDCARAAKRLGKDVKLVFRRTEDDMRVRAEERKLAQEEGVALEPLVKPVEIMANQHQFVEGVKCLRMDFASNGPDNDWQLMPVPESEFVISADTVVIAIGHQPNSLIARFLPKLRLNKDKSIYVDSSGMTSIDGVFAAGNVVTNAGPVVEAIASGKQAAERIHQYMQKKVS